MAGINGTQDSTNKTYDPTADSSNTGLKDKIIDKNTFLQLLVAQLKNQDPLQPQDGAAFVAQLAQFSNLEQAIASRESLDAIRNVLAPEPTTT